MTRARPARHEGIRKAQRRGALLLGSALLGLLAGTPAMAAQPVPGGQAPTLAQSGETYGFSIAAQPLASALRAFSEQSGIQVAYGTEDLAGLSGPAVSGRLDAAEALRRLLAGSGVTWRFTDPHTVVLARAASDAAVTLGPVVVEGSGETADGPVAGYVARRSATGTKTDTPLIETPQSVSVVGSEQIRRQQSQTIGEALRFTPGILASQGFNRTDDGLYMRGFQINDSSLYVNGLRSLSNIYDGTTDPYQLERIEVLHGPASVLYGQSSPGGVVNMVTKLPTIDPLHEIEAQLGNDDRKQVATDHGGALDEAGQFSYRLTALVRDSGTMVDYIDDDKAFVAPAFTWRPDEDTALTLLATYSQSSTDYYYGFPAEGTVVDNPNGRIARNRFLGEPDFNKWERSSYSAGYRFEHRFDERFELRQNLRYAEFENNYNDIYFGSWLADERSVTRGAYSRNDQSSLFALDTQLQAELTTGPLEHTALLGIDYNRTTFQRVQYNGTVAPLDLYDPVYGASVTLASAPGTDSYQQGDQVGLYAQDQIALGSWRLLLGGRQDWANDRTDNHVTGSSAETDQSAFTGRVGLVYLFDFGLAPYVSYAESFEPQSGTDAGGGAFDPTTGQQVEAGLKFQPKGADSSVTLSFYHLTRQNVLTSDPDNAGFSVQTGEIRSRGVELEAKLALAEGLNLLAGYAYTDAEVTESNSGDLGTRPENTPEHMASLWADYAFQDGPLQGLRLGGGVRYVGDTVDLSATTTVPAYTVADAMVSYETGPWRLGINATNLFDKEYIAACTYGCFYGEGRTVIGSVALRW
ncbi:iron complex outermembrane recepter protein [Tistlia consotensis]|uniref:Iron complex outermembrane recepter protein n=1 Tax=Tistlia consotensis USBA 355 TaxID=560819 RepID=A0A1Y6CAW9_9PROT|nr:TonB-dependent siderophore receptor [Tistlia consotensis]SMF43551.1 iron complex outermembrane recepter protein [Tistlia consotensis USBA 355]SNR42679.1 iron complex outermembrane recepter protein [Tistlia consotensis]